MNHIFNRNIEMNIESISPGMFLIYLPMFFFNVAIDYEDCLNRLCLSDSPKGSFSAGFRSREYGGHRTHVRREMSVSSGK